MGATIGIRFGALAVTLALASCFAVVDVERFHSLPSPGPDGSAVRSAPGQYSNLKLTLVGMTPHVSQLFEYRVIDANNFVQSRGMVNPLGAANVTINAPFAVPNAGSFHFDFYADVNGSGGYDGIGLVVSQDHAWRVDPLDDYPTDSVVHVDGLIQVTFTHNTSFTHIEQYPSGTPNPPHDIGADAIIRVSNAQDLLGALIQVRIVNTVLDHTVGLFRVPQITATDFNMTIPGIVELGTEYAVLVYVDSNLNNKYDDPATPPGDLGWRVVTTATVTGLDVTVDASTIQVANVDVGAP